MGQCVVVVDDGALVRGVQNERSEAIIAVAFSPSAMLLAFPGQQQQQLSQLATSRHVHLYTTTERAPMSSSSSSSFFPTAKRRRKRKLGAAGPAHEGEGPVPRRTEEQALQLLIKKATSVRRQTAPRATIAEGKGDDTETDQDKACWAELKKLLRGGDEALARQAFGFLLGQLRDRRPEVRLHERICYSYVVYTMIQVVQNLLHGRSSRLSQTLQVRKRALLVLDRLVTRSVTVRTELARNIRVSLHVLRFEQGPR